MKNALSVAALCAIMSSVAAPAPATPHALPSRSVPAPARPAASARTALRFEANRGQTDARTGFVARGRDYALFLSPTEAVYALGADEGAVRVALVGASARAKGEGEGELAGRTSYMTGNDRSRWVSDVRSYAAVRYRDVYPGVDLVYHGGPSGEAEYDFALAPGADVSKIALRVAGAESVRVDGDDLVIATCSGELRHREPAVYQSTADGARRAVAGRYDLRADGTIGFRVAAYDRALPLVVDPVIAYSTFLGGGDVDFAETTGLDATGAIYVAGGTRSADFPGASVPPGTTRGNDVFVTKLTPAGDAVVYSVVVGGAATDYAAVMKVSPAGEVVVRGLTASTDFPTSNAAQPTYGGGDQDIFVFKLNAAGSSFAYSTYLGGNGHENCFLGLDVDAAGDAFVSGCTMSTDFPVKNASQSALNGNQDGFVVKYGPTGEVAFSTYFGGSAGDIVYDVAVGPAGVLYLAGYSDSSDLLTIDPIQPALAGGADIFMARMSPDGVPVYSTYFGGSGDEYAGRIVVDALGAAYVGGQTDSTDFPTTGAFQATYGGGTTDAFVLKLAPGGASIEYASYLGGSSGDVLYVLSVDKLGAAHVGGVTSSTDYPTVDPIQSVYGGGAGDIFVAKVSPLGDELEFSTYVGGSDDEFTNQGLVDANGNLYVAFFSASADFPLVRSLQTLSGRQDAGVFEIADEYSLDWNAPTTEGGAPTDLEATLVDTGAAKAFPARASAERSPRAVASYNVYRSTAPNVPTTPENLFTSVPATQTSVSGAPGGSFYVVTAVYDDGTESGPSNQAGAGSVPGPGLTTVKVKPTKVTAKGTGFTSQVQVFLDGVPFATPAKVKKGTKVVQTGALLTGETIGQYLAAHGQQAIVTFRNRDGGVSAFTYKK